MFLKEIKIDNGCLNKKTSPKVQGGGEGFSFRYKDRKEGNQYVLT